MRQINFNHLRYFWAVARRGSLTEASQDLFLTPQTVSAQIKTLEKQMGQQLFEKSGRDLVLTDVGRTVFEYADEMFQLGQEMLGAVSGDQTGPVAHLRVGITDIVPKLVGYHVLEPILDFEAGLHLECVEGSVTDLLSQLAVRKLDLVVATTGMPPGLNLRATTRRIGSSPIVMMGSSSMARKLRPGFPKSLEGAPVVLPGRSTALHSQLTAWFERHEVTPKIIGEFEDSALLKIFGEKGLGLFPIPERILPDVRLWYGVHVVGHLDGVSDEYHVFTPQSGKPHPLIRTIVESAEEWLSEG